MTRALCAALLLLASCSCEGWPWTERPSQLPLGGDRECSDPVLGQVAAHCCSAHDNAYWAGGADQDRFTADAEFLACMALAGVPEDIAMARYRAVRLFGAASWNASEHRSRGPAR